MKYAYKLRTDIVESEDGEKFTVFGIDIKTHFGCVLESVPDIFFDRKQAEDFVERCNREEVSVLFIMDEIDAELP